MSVCECNHSDHRDAETYGRTSRQRKAVGTLHAQSAPIRRDDSQFSVRGLTVCESCAASGHWKWLTLEPNPAP